MNDEYLSDRTWADAYVPEARRIVGAYFVQAATLEQDTQEATDLIVFTVTIETTCRIAFRVRRPAVANAYPFDFTLRARRDSGTKTEMRKIIADGWGDWMLYAIANPDESGKFARWMLLDLHELRAQLAQWALMPNGSAWCCEYCKLHDNGDGTRFFSFDVRGFRSALVLEASHPIPFESGDATL